MYKFQEVGKEIRIVTDRNNLLTVNIIEILEMILHV